MKVWKRNIVVVAIVAFVGVAVYLNWSYNNGSDLDDREDSAGLSSLTNGQNVSEANPAETASGTVENGDETGENGTGTGYFASARLNRQQARDNALELLREAAADEAADQSMIDDANESIQVMASFTMSEAQIENLVTAKGYGDCICFINENSVSVVVSTTETGLNEGDIAKISEIVMEETGLDATQIRIIETEP